MALEVAQFIHQLNPNYPDGDFDTKAFGDDHIKLIKQTLQNTWANVLGAVTASHTEMNFLVGVTSNVLHDAKKNVANGVAGLDAAGRIGAAQMALDPALATIRLSSTVPADLFSGGHGIQIGPTAGINMAQGGQNIQVRQNGAPLQMYLNPFGGGVQIGILTVAGGISLSSTTGGVNFYHNGERVLRTSAQGIGGLWLGHTDSGLLIHDGVNIILQDVIANGSITLQGVNSSGVLVNMAIFDPNNVVTFYANGVRMQLHPSGATIPGTVTADYLQINQVGNFGGLTINGTDIHAIIDARAQQQALGVTPLVQGGRTGAIGLTTSSVTFPFGYSDVPSVVIQPRYSGGAQNGNWGVFGESVSGFSFYNGTGVVLDFNWIATGPR